jgi:integrase/recombinase XerD
MKVAGNGQGKILTPEELKLLFAEGFTKERDRVLFGICLFTGCHVSEALALQITDIKDGTLTFRKSTTKGKLKTRVVDIQPPLAQLLAEYQPLKAGALFPGMRGRSLTLTRFMADKILKAAWDRVGFVGVSTHSFRRTALTRGRYSEAAMRGNITQNIDCVKVTKINPQAFTKAQTFSNLGTNGKIDAIVLSR